MRKLLVTANRNGFQYVLDRATGEFLNAKAFVKQTWLKEFDKNGRPVVLPERAAHGKGDARLSHGERRHQLDVAFV